MLINIMSRKYNNTFLFLFWVTSVSFSLSGLFGFSMSPPLFALCGEGCGGKAQLYEGINFVLVDAFLPKGDGSSGS